MKKRVTPPVLRNYQRNWMKALQNKPIDRSLTALCWSCEEEGVLAEDIFYRHHSKRPSSLLCQDCFGDVYDKMLEQMVEQSIQREKQAAEERRRTRSPEYKREQAKQQWLREHGKLPVDDTPPPF